MLGLKGAASHLVGRIPYFSVNNSLIVDVLQFSALGVGCAAAAVLLYEGVRVSEVALRPLPRILSAPLAGALCGAIALRFPQVGGWLALRVSVATVEQGGNGEGARCAQVPPGRKGGRAWRACCAEQSRSGSPRWVRVWVGVVKALVR